MKTQWIKKANWLGLITGILSPSFEIRRETCCKTSSRLYSPETLNALQQVEQRTRSSDWPLRF